MSFEPTEPPRVSDLVGLYVRSASRRSSDDGWRVTVLSILHFLPNSTSSMRSNGEKFLSVYLSESDRRNEPIETLPSLRLDGAYTVSNLVASPSTDAFGANLFGLRLLAANSPITVRSFNTRMDVFTSANC